MLKTAVSKLDWNFNAWILSTTLHIIGPAVEMKAYRAEDLLAITDIVGLLRGRGRVLDD
jgi:hypothetical protein